MSSKARTVPGTLGAASARGGGDEDFVGQTVSSWVVESRLAAGGFGELFRARHAETGERVAIKVLHADLAATPQVVARFAQEAEILATLRHAHLLGLIEFGQLPDRRPYLVVEYVEGVDLDRHLAETGRMPLAEVQAIVGQIAEALEVAHAAGVIHRDIKASNVILRRAAGLAGDASAPAAGGAWHAVLIDFGVAKLLSSDVPLTVSRQIVGTPFAMAPEQLEGKPVDARTDVYSLGALAFHMLAGRPPFEIDDVNLLAQLKKNAAPPALTSFVAVEPAVASAVAAALSAHPEHRPASARSLAVRLQAATTCNQESGTVAALTLAATARAAEALAAITALGGRATVIAETSDEVVAEFCCERHLAEVSVRTPWRAI